jgi:hypothetical protein
MLLLPLLSSVEEMSLSNYKRPNNVVITTKYGKQAVALINTSSHEDRRRYVTTKVKL